MTMMEETKVARTGRAAATVRRLRSMWRIRRRRRRKNLSLEKATPARVIHLQMPRALEKSQAKLPKIMTMKIRSKRSRKGRNRSEYVEMAKFWGEVLLLFFEEYWPSMVYRIVDTTSILSAPKI